MVVSVVGNQRDIAMMKALRTSLVAAQLIGAWFAVAQATNDPPNLQQQSTSQPKNIPVSAENAISTTPQIAISPSKLDFGLVAVGSTKCLTFTVRNVGSGTLSGFALTSLPFSTSNSFYSLGSAQHQVLTVRYAPKVIGTNLQSVALKGGGGATVTVSGCGESTPAPPSGLHVVGGGS